MRHYVSMRVEDWPKLKNCHDLVPLDLELVVTCDANDFCWPIPFWVAIRTIRIATCLAHHTIANLELLVVRLFLLGPSWSVSWTGGSFPESAFSQDGPRRSNPPRPSGGLPRMARLNFHVSLFVNPNLCACFQHAHHVRPSRQS